MGISGWHVRLQNLPPAEVPACGPGFDYIMDAFGWLGGLRMIFTGSGECAAVNWEFLGPQHAGLGLHLVRRARRPRHRRQLVAGPRLAFLLVVAELALGTASSTSSSSAMRK